MTQPPVLFGASQNRRSQVISLLFADAQTHYSEFRGNLMFEANACTGDGAMIKSWQTNFQNNILADSSMPRGAWIGSYSGPVGLMTFTHNVYWNATGYCGVGWPSAEGHFVAPPDSPTGLGTTIISGNYALDNGDSSGHGAGQNAIGVGYGGVLGNATGTCYHTMDQDNVTGAIGCNHYPNCNWPGHMSNYHLTETQLETDVVTMIDYELHEMPQNPNLTKALKLLNRTWNAHSMQATKDPFARTNKPWNTNTTDFVASSDEAQKVGHVPLPVHEIGLGAFFDEAFDREMVGRRQAFREGEPGCSVESAPPIHFEDADRVRGLTVSASLGLIATKEFNMGATTWAVVRNVELNHGGAAGATKTVSVTVRAQTNGVGGCGDSSQQDAAAATPWATCPVLLWNASDLSCESVTAPGGGTCGRLKALAKVPSVAACCAACKATAGCLFFTASTGDQRCYLNSKWAGRQPISSGVFSGSLTDDPEPPPPPPPPPPAKPLKLTFSLGAPSPLGGADAVAIGSMTLVNGAVLPSGGAESGLYSATGSGPWCDFTAELQLPASVASGSVHDLYVSMLAENTTLQRFTLDYFKLRA